MPNFDITALQGKHTIPSVTSLDNTHSYQWADPASSTHGAALVKTFVFEADGRFLFQNTSYIFSIPLQTILNWYGSYRIANNVIELVWQNGDHQTLAFANTGSALVIGAKTYNTFKN